MGGLPTAPEPTIEGVISGIRDALAAENRRLAGDDSPLARAIVANNRITLRFLTQAEDSHRCIERVRNAMSGEKSDA